MRQRAVRNYSTVLLGVTHSCRSEEAAAASTQVLAAGLKLHEESRQTSKTHSQKISLSEFFGLLLETFYAERDKLETSTSAETIERQRCTNGILPATELKAHEVTSH